MRRGEVLPLFAGTPPVRRCACGKAVAARPRTEVQGDSPFVRRIAEEQGPWVFPRLCPVCAEREEAGRAARRRAADEAERAERLGLPAEFREASLMWFRADLRDPALAERQREARLAAVGYAASVLGHAAAGNWFGLLGGVGTGKSLLAAGIANEAWAHGLRGRWWHEHDLDQALLDCQRSERSLRAFVEAEMQRGLLVVDDLGSSRLTAAGLERVGKFLERRCERGGALVFTTNLDWAALEERLRAMCAGSGDAQRLVSRVNARCRGRLADLYGLPDFRDARTDALRAREEGA